MAFSMLLLLASQVTPPALLLDNDAFVVRGLGKEVREPVAPTNAQATSRVTYRKDDAFAVWDSRGLSVRHGSFTFSTRLPDIALTPKLFTKDEILANRADMKAGAKKKEASALSGSRRIGDEAYFMVRWDDSAGKPWLEALVKVNLKTPKPKPELVGRFDGYSVAKGPIGDQLVLLGTSPASFVSQPDGGWGVGTYDRLKKEFGFKLLGRSLDAAVALSPRLALAMERTDYGKVRVARIDLVTGARRDVAEFSGSPAFVDSEIPPLVRVPTNLGSALRNLETGVQLNLPEKAEIRRTAGGILVWPGGRPEGASLYSPERFLKLASVGKTVPQGDLPQSKPTIKKPPP